MRRVGFMLWKELIELGQDPRLFGIVIMAPLIQLFLLAYAANTDVTHVRIVVADADRSVYSRQLIERFTASPTFDLVAVVSGPGDIDRFLERGEAALALDIPADYGRHLAAGGAAGVQVVADGSDANSSGLSLGYASNLIAAYNQELLTASAAQGVRAGAAVRVGALEPRVRVWFNPRLESRDFMIPGIVAMLLLVVTTNLSSMGIVREKELGTLEQLNVTPLRRWELVVGKLLPYALIGMLDVALVLGVAVEWFRVPMLGSVPLLFAMSAVYLLCTLSLGLFVSTISSTQQQAMMTTTFFFLMPMVLLSGFVFPIENMPEWIQPITYLIPLRYFLVILRSIFLKGVGLDVLWPQAAALFTWGTVVLLLAVARSSKRAT